MELKDRLKQKRIECGYTLEELAKMIGTSKQTIHRYESGIISNIPSDKIEAMAIALHTSPGFLMGWEEPQDAYAMSASSGDIKKDDIGTLIDLALGLNEDGTQKLIEYAQDLAASGRYSDKQYGGLHCLHSALVIIP